MLTPLWLVAVLVAVDLAQADTALTSFAGPYRHSAISGQNLFSRDDITDAENCAQACLDDVQCRTFEVGPTGCFGSELTREQAGTDRYVFDASYELYELLEEPTAASCLSCDFVHDGLCGWVANPGPTPSCRWKLSPVAGIEYRCSSGTATIDSPWSARITDGQCFAIVEATFTGQDGEARDCQQLQDKLLIFTRSKLGDAQLALNLVSEQAGLCHFKATIGPSNYDSQLVLHGKDLDAGAAIRVQSVQTVSCGSRQLVLQCPDDITKIISIGSTTKVSWDTPTPHYATANKGSCSRDAAKFSCSTSKVPNSDFPVGTTQVSYSCSDRLSLTQTCSFQVNVVTSESTTARTTTSVEPCGPKCQGVCYQDQCLKSCPKQMYPSRGQCKPFPQPPVNLMLLNKSPSRDEIYIDWDNAPGDHTVRGFRLHKLVQGQQDSDVIDVGWPEKPLHFNDPYPADFEYKIEGLTADIWFFYLLAYNDDGVESVASEVLQLNLKRFTTSRPATTTTLPSPPKPPSPGPPSPPRTTTRRYSPPTTTTVHYQPKNASSSVSLMQTLMIAGSVFTSILAIFFLVLFLWKRGMLPSLSRRRTLRVEPRTHHPALGRSGPRWQFNLAEDLKDVEDQPLLQENSCELDFGGSASETSSDIDYEELYERALQARRKSQQTFLMGTGVQFMDTSDSDSDGQDDADDGGDDADHPRGGIVAEEDQRPAFFHTQPLAPTATQLEQEHAPAQATSLGADPSADAASAASAFVVETSMDNGFQLGPVVDERDFGDPDDDE